MSDDAVIILTGVAAAVACAIPGCFLVLRGISLIGDAISHAVLPGIVIAFLVTHSLAAWPVVIGAAAFGLLTVFLIESLTRSRRIKEDASIAVVFPALFALGVLILVRYVDHVDLDPDCVLHGEILHAPILTMSVLGFEISRPLFVLLAAALVNIGFAIVLFKELKLSTFDAGLAAASGFSPVLLHYLLTGVVSLTTVASFEAVGAILVVAFLIVPAAAAYLLTDNLLRMLLLACAIGAASAFGGFYLAVALDASVAGSMTVVMGALFGVVWLLSPREGILGRALRRRRVREHFALALVLEHLGRDPCDQPTLASALAWPEDRVATLVDQLGSRGFVDRRERQLVPTRAGEDFVRSVVD
ncbi:MAG: metal ABC transporter permease [Planctomycetota bacterium]|jgi:manganese/zinc/iron transport system permease protein